jgi:hypothetical protein
MWDAMDDSSKTDRRARLNRRRWLLFAATSLVVLLAAGAWVTVLYGRGGGPLPAQLAFLGKPDLPQALYPSGPEEQVLRTLRLLGYEHAAVGEDASGTVVVRVEMPKAAPIDIEYSWQAALTTGAGAFPDSRSVVAQLFSGSIPLLEVTAPTDVVRDAAARNDAAGIRNAASFRYLQAAPGGVPGG